MAAMSSTRDDNAWDREEPGLQRKLLTGIGVMVGVVVLYLIGAAIIPRWWAQRVGDVVNERLTVGALFGLFIGLVFTAVPLLAAWAIVRWRTERRTWKGWLGWLVVVALTAAPNLMTLGIVLGSSNAAHAGERILDVEGPGFRMWSLIGAIVAVAAVLGVVYLARSRRSSRRRESDLRSEMDTRRSDE